WEAWADLYATATGGRLFAWTKKQREHADEISQLVKSKDPEFLTRLQRNFLADTFWAATGPRKLKTPWPLEALKKNVNDFMPAPLTPTPDECEHPADKRRIEKVELEEKIIKKETCLICKKVLAEKTVKDIDKKERVLKMREEIERVRGTRYAIENKKLFEAAEQRVIMAEAELAQHQGAA
ncbi:MAG: hypothetical protein ACRD2G_15420, partial [Terriglobia bacterium]